MTEDDPDQVRGTEGGDWGAEETGTPSDDRHPSLAPRRALLLVATLGVGLAVLAGVLVFDGADGEQTSSDPAAQAAREIEGRPAPEVTFQTFEGERASLADYLGRPLVVNFWASWCPPCVVEMPEFEKVHQEVGDRVTFLGMNTQDTRDDAAKIVEETGVTYDLARDPDAEAFEAFGVYAMPSTFFISPDGVIVDTFAGPLTREALTDRIRQHLLDG